ncbi:MAG: hypothetical protein P4L86_17345 [Mycobacterium sp.]|nr:hypothetical protein [Mycobacterium sp.]
MSSSSPSLEAQPSESGDGLSAQIGAPRKRLYWAAAIALVLWTAAYIYAVLEVIPNGIYWLSYYAMNYDDGFVRRGLAGAIVGLFPNDEYFVVATVFVVGTVVAYFSGLLALMVCILKRGPWAERRLAVALLVPVLPCSVSFALLGPRPELAVAGALVFFGIALSRAGDLRGSLTWSAGYGLFIAVMAFVHEGLPLEFALGAVLAISVIAPVQSASARWGCIAMATGPGLLATAAVSLLGRRDTAAVICQDIPHATLRNTFKVPPDKVWDYLSGHFQSVSDYHDWVCANILPAFDKGVESGMHDVWGVGLPELTAGFAHGLLVCVATVFLISYATGVRVKTFRQHIRGGLAVPAVALALMIPVFATGVDWIRWWVVILINIACVYLLFAAGRPEIEAPVSKRQLKVLLAIGILLAVIPFGGAAGYATGFAHSG